MSERIINRKIYVILEEEESDPYDHDYKIKLQGPVTTQVIALTELELLLLREEINELLP